jgi:hypothetical protein
MQPKTQDAIGSTEHLSVILHAPGFPPFEGTVIDATRKGSAIVLEPPTAPRLVPGSRVELEFEVPGAKRSFHVEAEVEHRVELLSHYLYGFKFTRANALEEGVPHALRTVFDRRAAPRVAVDAERPIVVQLNGTEGEDALEVPLIDLSVRGLSVRFPAQFRAVYGLGRDVRVSLLLPGCVAPVELRGRIVHHLDEANRVVAGIEFHGGAGGALPGQLAAILDYVSKRMIAESEA